MDVEFDADKDVANQSKHGLSLGDAERMDLGAAVITHDSRYDYGEDRFQARGLIGGRLHLLMFTMRGDVLRAISLRRANSREEKRYEEKA